MIYVEGEYVDLWENKYKNGILDRSIEDQFYKLFNKEIEIIYRVITVGMLVFIIEKKG